MMSFTTVPLLTFLSPPLPYFIESDRKCYEVGEAHPSRSNMGTFDLLYVRSGGLHIVEGDKSWTLGPGQLLILRPDTLHYSNQTCTERTEFDWVHFQTAGDWEESAAAQEATLRGDHYIYAIRLPKTMTLTSPEAASSLFDRLQEAAGGTAASAFWQRQQLFLQLLRLIDEDWRSIAAPTAVGVAERAATYLKRNYQLQVTNTGLGGELQLHPNYIARCMIEVYGITPQQYLLHYRMDQAKLMLIKTDWPVARIAEETGFRQTPHFSRTFSEHTGISPLQYRKQYTNDTP
ncbi:AraC family transcriptional regulator [Paenibacillus abyssi]|uniref:HTH araC/xylS-type domain-containing protein n=1 Tax=Paenibacillus abyssi TaxID=1340531 RepID=A0A917G1K1_9BACL|nr:AraC family transcriptional regulator [Paenibacillus abyssi]GGG17456.1 hypothetical protein GCM10010916_37880 [Paenibacillus abyssi]